MTSIRSELSVIATMRNPEDKIVFLKAEPFDVSIVSKIKEIPGRFWNSETKLWESFGNIVSGNVEYYCRSLIHELKSRNYSRRTFTNYVSTVRHFLEKTGSRPEKITPEEIEHYLINLQEGGLAPKTPLQRAPDGYIYQGCTFKRFIICKKR